eukprot:gene8548-17628_t
MSSQGFGCMGFSAFYSTAKPVTIEDGKQVINKAISDGVTLFNTANFYGPLNVEGFGANLRFIKGCLDGIDRSKVELMVKIGMDTRAPVEKTGQQWILSGKAESLIADVDYALSELGTDYLDIIVLCRVPLDVPIEEAVLAMKAIVDQGKARRIGLSEASAATIRRAAAVAPIYCIEQEWSLWSRDAEAEVIPTCRELGIKIVAYSPLGRGFLTGSIQSRDDLLPGDFRIYGQPKFAEGNFEKNLKLVEALNLIANRKGCTPGQVALAWVHAQGPDVIPIPGTTSVKHLEENLAARNITFDAVELEEINSIFTSDAVVGSRYTHGAHTFQSNQPAVASADFSNTE